MLAARFRVVCRGGGVTGWRAPALLVLLVALSFADVLLLGRGFFKGDLFRYHFPMKKVVRDLTFAEGLPQWNPAFSGGQPLAANPAYELFYPPQWLIYLPSFAYGFQLHILLHIAIAALAMYFFLRSLELSEWASAFGAIAFALGAPYLSLLLRLPFLFSMSWLPLVLLFARRAILQPSARSIALGAIAFGMQALIGEPTVVLQSGLLVASYLVYRWFRDRRFRVVPVTLLFAGGLLIATAALVPAIDHARTSVRSEGFTWQIASNWSTPPSRLVELAWPRVYRTWTGSNGEAAIRTMYARRTEPFISDIYLGLLVFALAGAGFLRGMRGWGYVLALTALSFLLAFGEHGPLFEVLFRSGLLASIRYPEKFLLMGAFALIVWAAMMFDALLRGDERLRKTAMFIAIGWLVLTLLFWMSSGAHVYWMWNVARAIAVIALLSRVSRPTMWRFAALAFLIADAAFVHTSVAARAPRSFFDPPPLAQQLQPHSRLFHAARWDLARNTPLAVAQFGDADLDIAGRDALFPYTPAAFGAYGVLENDLDQTGLLSSTRFLRAAQEVWGRTNIWHPWFLSAGAANSIAELNPSVTIHPLPAHPRYVFASRLTSDADLPSRLLANTIADGDTCVPFAPFVPAAGRVLHVSERPSAITLDVVSEGRAFLVASVTSHKYWSATLDGQRAELLPANIGFQAMIVPAGTHRIEMRYRNPMIVPCGVVSLIALLAAIAIAVMRTAVPKSQPRSSDRSASVRI